MSRKVVVIIFTFILNLFTVAPSLASEYSNEPPTIIEFNVSKKTIDLTSPNLELEFTLIASHPQGIKTNSTDLWLISRDKLINLKTILTKQPKLDSEKNTTFKGKLSLDPTYTPGLYDFYAEPIESTPNAQRNLGTFTSRIYPAPFNDFYNGETSVLVRKAGRLDLDEFTFVGPSYSSSVSFNDGKPVTYLNDSPIFRIGEIYDPQKFFISRINDLKLEIESLTNDICATKSGKLYFNNIGFCTFRVFTSANSNYLAKSITFSVSVAGPRIKPELFLPTVEKQDISNLPKTLKTTPVYASYGGIIAPITKTPEVCYANIQFITIVGGGRCVLNYQSSATNDYLASDLYTLAFDVSKDAQTVTFKPQATVDLSVKTLDLSATASSNGAITFTSSTTEICTVSGTKLNLLKSGNCNLVASQAGTPLIAAASANATVQITGEAPAKTRTITCIKGKKSKKVTGVKPKCPKGFKKK
jgi:hypothetical protein